MNFDYQSVDYGFYVHREFKGEEIYEMCEVKHLLQYLGLLFSFLRVSFVSLCS